MRTLDTLFTKTNQYGITTTEQLRTFLKVAEAGPEGATVGYLAGTSDSQAPETKAVRGQLRRLGEGYYREEGATPGLGLIKIRRNDGPQGRGGPAFVTVSLTARGKRLYAQIQKIMG